MVCARVGISITESESTMKDEDIWFMCYERFMETINNLNVSGDATFNNPSTCVSSLTINGATTINGSLPTTQ